MLSIEYILLGASVLLLLSIIASKASDKVGIPSLLLFLVVGMLAGSDGPGGIHFDDPYLAQFIGVVALSFILFAGGMDRSCPHRCSIRKGCRRIIAPAFLNLNSIREKYALASKNS